MDAKPVSLTGALASFDDVYSPRIAGRMNDYDIKIAHAPLLVGPGDSGEYTGAYWTGTQMVMVDDLGSDQEEALEEFRDYLVERGET